MALPPDEQAWSTRRSDARRNHERVLAAAVEVFTEHGLDATIPQVAARAGVGKATVYRSYPTKADLVRALAQQHVEWLQGIITEAAVLADTDAYQALATALHAVTSRIAQDRLMVEVLGAVDGTGDDLIDDTGDRSLEHLLAKGREQGTLRADVTVMDIKVLAAGFSRSLIDMEIHDLDVWRRYTDLTLAALRP